MYSKVDTCISLKLCPHQTLGNCSTCFKAEAAYLVRAFFNFFKNFEVRNFIDRLAPVHLNPETATTGSLIAYWLVTELFENPCLITNYICATTLYLFDSRYSFHELPMENALPASCSCAKSSISRISSQSRSTACSRCDSPKTCASCGSWLRQIGQFNFVFKVDPRLPQRKRVHQKRCLLAHSGA